MQQEMEVLLPPQVLSNKQVEYALKRIGVWADAVCRQKKHLNREILLFSFLASTHHPTVIDHAQDRIDPSHWK